MPYLEVLTLVSKSPDIRDDHVSLLLAMPGNASWNTKQTIIEPGPGSDAGKSKWCAHLQGNQFWIWTWQSFSSSLSVISFVYIFLHLSPPSEIYQSKSDSQGFTLVVSVSRVCLLKGQACCLWGARAHGSLTDNYSTGCDFSGFLILIVHILCEAGC